MNKMTRLRFPCRNPRRKRVIPKADVWTRFSLWEVLESKELLVKAVINGWRFPE